MAFSILHSLKFDNWGPFRTGEIQFAKDVTVLTGANDVGKSRVLRALEMLSHERPAASEEDANLDYIQESPNAWTQSSFGVTARFEVTNPTGAQVLMSGVRRELIVGDLLTFKVEMAPDLAAWSFAHRSYKGESPVDTGQVNFRRPIVLKPLQAPEIREYIPMTAPTPSEMDFLRLAFGGGNPVEKLSAFREPQKLVHLSKAEERLDKRLQSLGANALDLRLRLQLSADGLNLLVLLQERDGSRFPLGVRGSGVRKLLQIVASLLGSPAEKDTLRLVLLDEPENSLHADAQHAFRRLLFHVARSATIQVVYATHSSAMIDTQRPDTVRLLARTNRGGLSGSVVTKDAFHNRFAAVRASLGVDPSDSLFFGRIVLIVEGKTEVSGLAALLVRLAESQGQGHRGLQAALSACMLLDGEGDSAEYLVRLAKGAGSKVVVLLDGDKQRLKREIETRHEDVPVVLFPSGQEFEDIVPLEVYLRAAAEQLDPEARQNADRKAFDGWHEQQATAKPWLAGLPTSKRVSFWLEDVFDRSLDKPEAVRVALSTTPIEAISLSTIEDVAQQVRALLKR